MLLSVRCRSGNLHGQARLAESGWARVEFGDTCGSRSQDSASFPWMVSASREDPWDMQTSTGTLVCARVRGYLESFVVS